MYVKTHIYIYECQFRRAHSAFNTHGYSEFLPRGDGIVTRCPIIINCVPHADDMDGKLNVYTFIEHNLNV